MATDFRKLKAIEQKNKERILAVNPAVREASGIYILTRYENGFKYAYVGQAKRLLTRLTQHLNGYQHIDLSIKKHGFWNNDNPTGWHILFQECDEADLNTKERELIQMCADEGFQLRNKTAGGQDGGKFGIADNRPAKGYHDGLKQGYENARREIKHLFDLHLVASIKSNKPNKTQEKVLQKFIDFLNGGQ